MKIALVSPYDYPYPGGVTGHIAHLEENFRQMGHSVKIIAPSSSDKRAMAAENVLVVGRPVSIPVSGSIARIAVSPRLSGRVKQILDQERFDIVHLHEPLVPVLPITILRFSKSINIGTFHAYADRNLGYFYGKRILKRWFRKLDGKIAVSKPAMEFVRQYFPGYYNIIPNGIDYEHFSAEVPALPEFDDGRLNILFVGRMEKRKGFKYLLRAYARVKIQFPNCRLIVVGPRGRLSEEYQSVVEKSRLEDVVFTGYVPYAVLPRYYRSAHVFCSPATGQESFGIVLLEAMAAGRPIVASNIEGYASVVEHGTEGLLVPPKDVDALSAAILKLLRDRDLREMMSEQGRLTAQEYSWKRVSRKVLAYYERLLSESGPEPSAIAPRLATAEG